MHNIYYVVTDCKGFYQQPASQRPQSSLVRSKDMHIHPALSEVVLKAFGKLKEAT